MNKNRLNPDAPRLVLRRLVKEAPMSQKAVAAAVGEREDTFSKTLSGTPGYDLDTPQLVNVLNIIGVDFARFAQLVAVENEKLRDNL